MLVIIYVYLPYTCVTTLYIIATYLLYIFFFTTFCALVSSLVILLLFLHCVTLKKNIYVQYIEYEIKIYIYILTTGLGSHPY